MWSILLITKLGLSMRVGRLAATVWLVFAASFPAYGDWQYTKWGMPPEQVKEASGGVAVDARGLAPPSPQEFVGLTAPHVSGDFKFRASFVFRLDTKGLARIGLSLEPAKMCRTLRSELVVRYGLPLLETMPAQFNWQSEWLDRSNNLRVTYHQAGDPALFCLLSYEPIANGNNSGL
jgi:hypothetical protein